MLRGMPSFILHHRHAPCECGVAFAAWKGFTSPLRHRSTVGSCAQGGHALWWLLEAPDQRSALARLPRWLACRTEAIEISEVNIP